MYLPRSKLSRIHGFRCHDCRNNVRYSVDGKSVILHSAGVGLVLHLDSETRKPLKQFFFQEHTNDIRAMATCSYTGPAGSSRTFVATGETGSLPSISIWCFPEGDDLAAQTEDEPLKSMWTLKDFHKEGVSHLAFSIIHKDNSMTPTSGTAPDMRLLSVGLDRNHSVALYDLFFGGEVEQSPTFRLCCSEVSDVNTVLFAVSNPFDSEQFVTGGVHHLIFENSTSIWSRKVSSMTNKSRDTFVCAGSIDKDITVVGCVSGALKFVRLPAMELVGGPTVK